MKKLLTAVLSLVMMFTLSACGDGDSKVTSNSTTSADSETSAESYNREFTIYVNGSDKWTPFAGKSGVSFTVSDDKAISVSDNGSKISFTGKQVGESVITATLGDAVSKALVRVRAMDSNNNNESEKTAVPLIRELPDSFYVEYESVVYENTVSVCLTEGEYCKKYFDADAACYGWNKNYYTPSEKYIYWQEYGWMDTTEDAGWNSGKFNKWLTDGTEPIFYEFLCAFRLLIAEKGNNAVKDISQYDTGESETIANVKCEIYKIGPYSYWVEPTYHFCLKFTNNGEAEFTVTKYEAPYDGENILAPLEDEVIHTAANS